MSLKTVSATLLALSIIIPVSAQTRRLTAADYGRAEAFMGYNTNRLVYHAPGRPVWLSDDRCWYRVNTERGMEFVLVDPTQGTRQVASDQAELELPAPTP